MTGLWKRTCAHQARSPHHQAAQFPQLAAVEFGLHPPRNGHQFLAALQDSLVVAGNILDRLEELLPLFLHQFVGEDRVGDLHHVARRKNVAGHLVGDRQDFLNHQGGAGQRPEHGTLAAFDAAGDFHLALARQQRHGAHLAQVHAHRVVDLLGPQDDGQIEVEDVLAFLELFLEVLGLLENLDAGDVQTRQNVVEFGAAADIDGQNFAHLVVQDVALLLAHLYEPFEPPEFVVKRH